MAIFKLKNYPFIYTYIYIKPAHLLSLVTINVKEDILKLLSVLILHIFSKQMSDLAARIYSHITTFIYSREVLLRHPFQPASTLHSDAGCCHWT
jgi:hypothetical protein